MAQTYQLVLTPEQASNAEIYTPLFAKKAGVSPKNVKKIQLTSKSIDARRSPVKVNLSARVVVDEADDSYMVPPLKAKDVSHAEEVVIVGAGPAGLFAALTLIEHGLKPIIVERGKRIGERKRDVAAISTKSIVDPDSNYAFGEGGAGTFSDGKLYTRSKKKGDIKRIYELFYLYGAQEEILYEAHPHIGSDVLSQVVVNIRQAILEAGGQIFFKTKMSDLIVNGKTVKGIKLSDGRTLQSRSVILATGHSARDVYEILFDHKVILEPKPIAVGVRIEHPQELINQIQYHSKAPDPYLPPASYKLVKQIDDRGVYSFCMCPGGFVVPATTHNESIVVNGMSPSKRNGFYANSGIVVEIRNEDIQGLDRNPFAGIDLQTELEQLAYRNGGIGQVAPAQGMVDFVNSKVSPEIMGTSYFPGVVSSPMHFWLPENIRSRLQKAFQAFGKTMRGYFTNEAIILGVETRTSSPIRVFRDKENLHSFPFENLYPTGEGAGYAGGIVSSAIDGVRVARKIIEKTL